jgi:hypothetical protein
MIHLCAIPNWQGSALKWDHRTLTYKMSVHTDANAVICNVYNRICKM